MSELFDFSRLGPDELAALASAMGIGLPSANGVAPGAGRDANGAGPSFMPGPSSSSSSPDPPIATGSASTAQTAGPASTAAAATAAAAAASSRPDLVRLADVITHASLVLSHPTSDGDKKKKYTRSRRGCLTCRGRKVKCDEVRPTCLRCAGMGRECTWDKEDRNKRKQPDDGDGDNPPLSLPPTVSAALAEIAALAPALQAAQAGGGLPLPQPALQALAQLMPSFNQADSAASSSSQSQSQTPTQSSKSTAPTTTTTATSSSAPSADSRNVHSPPLPVPSHLYPWALDLPASVPAGQQQQQQQHERAVKRVRADTGSSSGVSANASASSSGPVPNPTSKPSNIPVAYGTAAWDEFMRASPFGGWTPNATAVDSPMSMERKKSESPPDSDIIELTRDTVTDIDVVREAPNVRLALRGQIARRRQPQPGPGSSPLGDIGSVEIIAPLARSLDPYAHAFPSDSARGLFRHYVDSTSGIVTAMGRGKPGQNPFLQVSLPLVLAETASPALTALRFALLTTSAAHILHLRGGNDPEAQALCDKLKRLAIGYTVLSENADADNVLVVLAACVIILTRDVLNADRTWRHNLDYALAAVRRRGGPEALMARDPSFIKRFVLEQLATHEVFSCFTTGNEPTLLTLGAKWWFEVERSSRSAWEWESVENQFGISRAMLEIVARVCSLCARRNRLGPDANLDDEDLAPVASFLRDEAETLITELEAFGVALRSLPYHRRVQYGDHIYRMTMSLHLITDILGLPASHPRVRAIVPAALELCSEISMQPVMLVWPLLWLARVCNMMEREWLRGLLSSYADQYCRDLQIAQELIYDVWAKQDKGEPFHGWHVLMAETGRDVLLI